MNFPPCIHDKKNAQSFSVHITSKKILAIQCNADQEYLPRKQIVRQEDLQQLE